MEANFQNQLKYWVFFIEEAFFEFRLGADIVTLALGFSN